MVRRSDIIYKSDTSKSYCRYYLPTKNPTFENPASGIELPGADARSLRMFRRSRKVTGQLHSIWTVKFIRSLPVYKRFGTHQSFTIIQNTQKQEKDVSFKQCCMAQ
jgi:hypothetical protein